MYLDDFSTAGRTGSAPAATVACPHRFPV